MMFKFSDPTKTETMMHENKWGGFNHAPDGWHEISEKDFAQSMFFSYNPTKFE